MVLYCAADLFWATRIKAAAEDLGIPCRPVRNLAMLEARLADSDVRGLIVDLEAGEGEPARPIALGMIGAARSAAPGVRVLAFGPHVEAEQFRAARAAGADQVLARSAFDRRLGEVLRTLEHGE